jgi:hypothetical protein
MVFFYYFDRINVDKVKIIPVRYWNLVFMHGFSLSEAKRISHRLNYKREQLERKWFIKQLFKK